MKLVPLTLKSHPPGITQNEVRSGARDVFARFRAGQLEQREKKNTRSLGKKGQAGTQMGGKKIGEHRLKKEELA